MKFFLRFFVVLALVTLGGTVNAATVHEQIDAAISSGNFDTVKSLVIANPESADYAASALLAVVQNNLISDTKLAAEAMSAAESLIGYVSEAAAGSIASAIEKIVKTIADNGLSGEGERGDQIAKILASAGVMAKSSLIATASPQLYAKIEGINGPDVQLAQLPSFKPMHNPPHSQPPNRKRGSQD